MFGGKSGVLLIALAAALATAPGCRLPSRADASTSSAGATTSYSTGATGSTGAGLVGLGGVPGASGATEACAPAHDWQNGNCVPRVPCPATTVNPTWTTRLTAPAGRLILQENSHGVGLLHVAGVINNTYQGVTYPISCVEVQIIGKDGQVVEPWGRVSGFSSTTAAGTFYGDSLITADPALSYPSAGQPTGFFSVQVRANIAGMQTMPVTVQEVGVGEVFVIAGQSNSSWNGDYPESSYMGAYMVPTETTATQPFALLGLDDNNISSSTGPALNTPQLDASVTWTMQHVYGQNLNTGSYWPRLAGLLNGALGVPIAFVPLSHGGTTVADWLPGAGPCANCAGEAWAGTPHYLFDRLVNSIKTVSYQAGGVRAVIWHQGEAEYGNAARYAINLSAIISTVRGDTGQPDLPFLVSEVTGTVVKPPLVGATGCQPLNPDAGAGAFELDPAGPAAYQFCSFPSLRYAQLSILTSAPGSHLQNVFLGAQADLYGPVYRRSGYGGHLWDGLHFTNVGWSNLSKVSTCQYQGGYQGSAYCDGFAAMANEYYVAIMNAFFGASYPRLQSF